MKRNKTTNAGGVNGLGESLVNTNSPSFQHLQQMIQQHHASQTTAEKMRNGIVSLRFQMDAYLTNDEVKTIVPAGSFMEQLLEVTGISKKKFSGYIDLDYSNLIATLKGRRKVNPELAIKAGKIFGINPEIWLHIESKNELQSYLATRSFDRDYSLAELVA